MRGAIKTVVAIAGLYLGARPAQAITWNFDQAGDAQGWLAYDAAIGGALESSSTPLRSEVRDGRWRIQTGPFEKGRFPVVKLVSPPLGYVSSLFDRVQVRCRVVHHTPVDGHFWLGWTNEHNVPGAPVQNFIDYSFSLEADVTYTTEWQEVTLAIVSGRPHEGARPVLWEGDLKDIDLGLALARVGPMDLTWNGGPEDVPEAVEIDWIRLTGVEELLSGELPPPVVTATATFGRLFTPAVFYPLCEERLDAYKPDGGLGDVDGDGDLDLVAPYRTPGSFGIASWLVAHNEGLGSFTRAVYKHGRYAGNAHVADVNGDGRADVVSEDGSWVKVAYVRSDPEAGWVVEQRFTDQNLFTLNDANGDGRDDLWMLAYPGQDTLWLLTSDGDAGFGPPRSVGADLLAEGYHPAYPLPGVGPNGEFGLAWWSDSDTRVFFALLSGLDFGSRVALPVRFNSYSLFLGDLEPDGDLDFAYTVNQTLDLGGPVWLDLNFLVNRGDGTADTLAWPQEVTLTTGDLQLTDLSADGRPDLAFVDRDVRQPAVVVALGAGAGLPVQEGRYPLSGSGGYVQAGDVDNDGDLDLVVYEKWVNRQGGVHVLLSRLAEGTTAVTEERTTTLPIAPVLSPAYPNPFNSSTLIPVSLPDDAQLVSLVIYDLLGQPVKKLVDGPLNAGTHLVRWDGADDRGIALSSGVYLYRLCAGDADAVGRVVLVR